VFAFSINVLFAIDLDISYFSGRDPLYLQSSSIINSGH